MPTAADIAILIPAYQPDAKLLGLVDALRAWFPHIVVVDDGSTEGRHVFDSIRDKVEALLVHPANRGKGAALKTGLAWMRAHLPDIAGVVTADADGQHRPKDIRRVAEATTKQKGGMLTGLAIRDTQTGLRGIPADLLERAAALPGDRYEYETRMLVDARHHASPPLQVPIKTVYLEGNKASHYRPFRDTLLTQAALWFR